MTKKNPSSFENPALGDGLLLEYFEDRIASLTLNRPDREQLVHRDAGRAGRCLCQLSKTGC